MKTEVQVLFSSGARAGYYSLLALSVQNAQKGVSLARLACVCCLPVNTLLGGI